MMCAAQTTTSASTLKQLTAEAADRFTMAFLAGQSLATELMLSCMRSLLDDDHALLEIARRELSGKNGMEQSLRGLIHAEAEQVAAMQLAHMERAQ